MDKIKEVVNICEELQKQNTLLKNELKILQDKKEVFG